jgi:hypothetical protein
MGFLYKLTFASGKAYVGLTRRTVEARYIEHASAVKDKRKRSTLYNAWRKYGAPVVETLGEVIDVDLLAAEVEAITVHRTIYPIGYNTTAGGDVCPMLSPEVAAKVAAAKVGKKRGSIHTDASKAKIAAARRGMRLSPETRAKISTLHKGRISKLRGRTLPDEVKLKISEANKARPPRGDDWRRKISASLTGKKQSPELIAKRAAGVRAAWAIKKAKGVDISNVQLPVA